MPSISAPDAISGCIEGLGVSHDLIGNGCQNAIQYSWEITDKPVGSAVQLGGSTTQNSNFTPDIAGDYEFEFCCVFETGNTIDPDLPPVSQAPELACPVGAIAGEEIFIPLNNCDGAVVWSVTGPIISAQGNTVGVNIQLDPLATGTVVVDVTCRDIDQTITVLNCSFDTHDPEALVEQKSPTVRIRSVSCGSFCQCIKAKYAVKDINPDSECEYSEITITIKDCTQPTVEICE